MYGLPETFDPSFLKGKEIESITFAAYHVTISLDENAWVQIEGSYKLLRDDSLIEDVDSFPISHSSLLQIVGNKIINITFAALNGDIELDLQHGLKLLIKGDIGPYESYRLFDGHKEVIV